MSASFTFSRRMRGPFPVPAMRVSPRRGAVSRAALFLAGGVVPFRVGRCRDCNQEFLRSKPRRTEGGGVAAIVGSWKKRVCCFACAQEFFRVTRWAAQRNERRARRKAAHEENMRLQAIAAEREAKRRKIFALIDEGKKKREGERRIREAYWQMLRGVANATGRWASDQEAHRWMRIRLGLYSVGRHKVEFSPDPINGGHKAVVAFFGEAVEALAVETGIDGAALTQGIPDDVKDALKLWRETVHPSDRLTPHPVPLPRTCEAPGCNKRIDAFRLLRSPLERFCSLCRMGQMRKQALEEEAARKAKSKRKRKQKPEWWLHVRDQKFAEQRGICGICEEPMEKGEGKVHLDHIIPESQGGETKPYNLQAVHAHCNLKKADLIPDEFVVQEVARRKRARNSR